MHGKWCGNEEKMFEEDKKIEEYIDERLLKVKDLNERKMLRELLGEVFVPFCDYIQTEYKNLEDKIGSEKENQVGDFSIKTGIIEKKKFDVTKEVMYPMVSQDMEEVKVDIKELRDAVSSNKNFYLFSIFLKADYLVIQSLIDTDRKFKGVIYTEDSEYRGVFKIRKNQKYLKMIEELYYIFNQNKISWQSVCAPYLHKIFDVYLCSTERSVDEQIVEVKVDFEELTEYVGYDYVPIWNVEAIVEKTSVYPEPCMDQIHYQHIIYKHRLEEDKEYLVTDRDIDLLNVRKINGDLWITCSESAAHKWNLYKINHNEWKAEKYPIFQNQRKDNGIEKNLPNYLKRIRTRAELKNFINSLGYEQYMELASVEVLDSPPKKIETYSMDEFIIDEIRIGKNNITLLLKFRVKTGNYFLNRDIMSYIVTRVQEQYPEYYCVGKL